MADTTRHERSSSPANASLPSVKPATLELLGNVPMTHPDAVAASVRRARAAQPAWAALSFADRARPVLRAKQRLVARQRELCDLITAEMGKPRVEALTSEVLPLANLMDYFARKSARFLRDETFSLSLLRYKRSRISYEPLGVVGIISPWNYPLSIPMGSAVMALMAGNAVVLKPSEFTPGIGLKIAALFREAGLPENLVQVVTGDGQTGAALVESGLDKLVFTGNAKTGRAIAEAAARRLLPCVLELSGKDAMIVCADAPFERTVTGAVWGAFTNCGQACASVERLYVVAAIAERFVRAVVEKTKSLRVGPGHEDESDVGPLANARQLGLVIEHVQDAVAQGAKVLTGGKRIDSLRGHFFEPTVLADVQPSMRVMQEETFGPVLPIQVVNDEEEAIREANRSRFGLLASVWTRDNCRGRELARRLEAGTVILNDALYTHGACETPWFGVKQSGWGVLHSRHGLREFVRMKHVNWDLLPLRSDPWWFPYSVWKRRQFERLLEALHRWGLKRWV